MSLWIPSRRIAVLSKEQYWRTVLSVRPDKLLAYYPLNDASGTVALNYAYRYGLPAAVAAHATYTGVDLGQPGIGDGFTAVYLDGSTDLANLYSQGLADGFDGAEGTLIISAKVANAGVWTDGAARRLVRLNAVTNTNEIVIRLTGNNNVELAYYAGGTTKTINIPTSATEWLCLAFSWSATLDQLRAYRNGIQISTTQTGLGTWAGAIVTALIGAQSTTPTNPWHGYGGHAQIYTAALTPAEMWNLCPAWLRGA